MDSGSNTIVPKTDRRNKLASLRESLKGMPIMKKMSQSLEERLEQQKMENNNGKDTSLPVT